MLNFTRFYLFLELSPSVGPELCETLGYETFFLSCGRCPLAFIFSFAGWLINISLWIFSLEHQLLQEMSLAFYLVVITIAFIFLNPKIRRVTSVFISINIAIYFGTLRILTIALFLVARGYLWFCYQRYSPCPSK